MGHRFDFDLNMLVALHALIEEKSVSKAARRMGITQPGMTYTLNKLRTQFNDQLLIRGTHEMRLSELAAELESPLQEMFEKVNRVIYHQRAFQPRDCELQFRFFLGYGEQSGLVERLFQHLSRQAPRACLRITPKASQELLDQGLVDCMLWNTATEGWHYCKLIHLAQHVLIARPGHPLLANGTPSLETFAQYGHIAVEHNMDARSTLEQDIAETLAQNGLQMRQSAVVVSYETAAGMVEKSDLIAIVPEHIAWQYDVARMAPPLSLRPFSVYLVWHERTHRHPAHAWFRAQVIDVLASMLPPADADAAREPTRRVDPRK